MFSRRGKSTIPRYLCFSNKEKSKSKLIKNTYRSVVQNNELNKETDSLILSMLQERMNDISRLNGNDINITSREVSLTPLASNPQSKRKLKSKAKLALKLKNKESCVPPLGHYQPVYNLIKPRISSACFHKTKDRKTIFDNQNGLKLKCKKFKHISKLLSLNMKKIRKLRRPQTSLAHRSNYHTSQHTPKNFKDRSSSLRHGYTPIMEYSNIKFKHKNNRLTDIRSHSTLNKRCQSAIKSSKASSSRVGSTSATYTQVNVDSSIKSLFH